MTECLSFVLFGGKQDWGSRVVVVMSGARGCFEARLSGSALKLESDGPKAAKQHGNKDSWARRHQFSASEKHSRYQNQHYRTACTSHLQVLSSGRRPDFDFFSFFFFSQKLPCVCLKMHTISTKVQVERTLPKGLQLLGWCC